VAHGRGGKQKGARGAFSIEQSGKKGGKVGAGSTHDEGGSRGGVRAGSRRRLQVMGVLGRQQRSQAAHEEGEWSEERAPSAWAIMD
jgi:hypothetical protein